MSIALLVIIFCILFLLELLYFKIADRYNIIDQPNHRSSHSDVTLRGGGIIFVIALLIYPLYFGFLYSYFFLGLAIISFVSFMDDIKPVSSKLRIVFHLVGVALMLVQLGVFALSTYWIILILIFVIGSINAVNFMDGINGITGSYGLITLCTLLWINYFVVQFISSSLIITSVVSVLVFNYFNFRKKAKCFAGDVGSVSIAFIILFLLLSLIIKTENLNYSLLLLMYGLDTVTTICFRAIRRENVFDAHRSHFYQYLANERKMPHLVVTSLYAIAQLVINVAIVLFMPQSLLVLCIFAVFSVTMFLIIRFYMEGSSKLLGN